MKLSYLIKAAMLFALLLIAASTGGCSTYRVAQETLQDQSRQHRHENQQQLIKYRQSYHYTRYKKHDTHYNAY